MNTIKVPFEIYRQYHRTGIPQFENFIFQDFILVVDGVKGINPSYIVEWQKEESQSMIFTVHENGEKVGKYQWLMTGDDITRGTLFEIPPHGFPEKEKKIARDATRLILFYMGYIMNYPRGHKQARLSSHRYSHEHRVSTRQNKIYLFDDIVKYISEKYIPKGERHSIQCPCWDVRGHYRHYKSGKVIFIQSYRKGKDKDTAQPILKQYVASSRKEAD